MKTRLMYVLVILAMVLSIGVGVWCDVLTETDGTN